MAGRIVPVRTCALNLIVALGRIFRPTPWQISHIARILAPARPPPAHARSCPTVHALMHPCRRQAPGQRRSAATGAQILEHKNYLLGIPFHVLGCKLLGSKYILRT